MTYEIKPEIPKHLREWHLWYAWKKVYIEKQSVGRKVGAYAGYVVDEWIERRHDGIEWEYCRPGDRPYYGHKGKPDPLPVVTDAPESMVQYLWEKMVGFFMR